MTYKLCIVLSQLFLVMVLVSYLLNSILVIQSLTFNYGGHTILVRGQSLMYHFTRRGHRTYHVLSCTHLWCILYLFDLNI